MTWNELRNLVENRLREIGGNGDFEFNVLEDTYLPTKDGHQVEVFWWDVANKDEGGNINLRWCEKIER